MTQVRINIDGNTVENWATEAEAAIMDSNQQFMDAAALITEGTMVEETVTNGEWDYYGEYVEYSYDTYSRDWMQVFENVFTTEALNDLFTVAQQRFELEENLRNEAVNYLAESITIDGTPLSSFANVKFAGAASLLEIPELSVTYDEATIVEWGTGVESAQEEMEAAYMAEIEAFGQSLWEAAQAHAETFSELTNENYAQDSKNTADVINYVFETIQLDGVDLATAFPEVYESTLVDSL